MNTDLYKYPVLYRENKKYSRHIEPRVLARFNNGESITFDRTQGKMINTIQYTMSTTPALDDNDVIWADYSPELDAWITAEVGLVNTKINIQKSEKLTIANITNNWSGGTIVATNNPIYRIYYWKNNIIVFRGDQSSYGYINHFYNPYTDVTSKNTTAYSRTETDTCTGIPAGSGEVTGFWTDCWFDYDNGVLYIARSKSTYTILKYDCTTKVISNYLNHTNKARSICGNSKYIMFCNPTDGVQVINKTTGAIDNTISALINAGFTGTDKTKIMDESMVCYDRLDGTTKDYVFACILDGTATSAYSIIFQYYIASTGGSQFVWDTEVGTNTKYGLYYDDSNGYLYWLEEDTDYYIKGIDVGFPTPTFSSILNTNVGNLGGGRLCPSRGRFSIINCYTGEGKDWESAEKVFGYNGSVYTDYTTEASSETGTFTLLSSTQTYLYIGMSRTFTEAYFDVATVVANYVLRVEYWNGSRWVANGTLKTINATPTVGGSGYSDDEVVTVTTGGIGGDVKIKTVDAGAVTEMYTTPAAYGYGYTTGTGKVTSGGSGTGLTIKIDEIYGFAITDYTQNPTYGFGKPGSMKWTAPGDWATTAINGSTLYWVRITYSSGTGTPTANFIRIEDNSIAGNYISTSSTLGIKTYYSYADSNIYGYLKSIKAEKINTTSDRNTNFYLRTGKKLSALGSWIYGGIIDTNENYFNIEFDCIFRYDNTGLIYSDLTEKLAIGIGEPTQFINSKKIGEPIMIFDDSQRYRLLIGHNHVFNTISFYVHSSSSGADSFISYMIIQYYDGTTWKNLDFISTVDNFCNNVRGGEQYITFKIPTDWAKTRLNKFNKYYLLIKSNIDFGYTGGSAYASKVWGGRLEESDFDRQYIYERDYQCNMEVLPTANEPEFTATGTASANISDGLLTMATIGDGNSKYYTSTYFPADFTNKWYIQWTMKINKTHVDATTNTIALKIYINDVTGDKNWTLYFEDSYIYASASSQRLGLDMSQYHTFRLEYDSGGNASFYIDNHYWGTLAGTNTTVTVSSFVFGHFNDTAGTSYWESIEYSFNGIRRQFWAEKEKNLIQFRIYNPQSDLTYTMDYFDDISDWVDTLEVNNEKQLADNTFTASRGSISVINDKKLFSRNNNESPFYNYLKGNKDIRIESGYAEYIYSGGQRSYNLPNIPNSVNYSWIRLLTGVTHNFSEKNENVITIESFDNADKMIDFTKYTSELLETYTPMELVETLADQAGVVMDTASTRQILTQRNEVLENPDLGTFQKTDKIYWIGNDSPAIDYDATNHYFYLWNDNGSDVISKSDLNFVAVDTAGYGAYYNNAIAVCPPKGYYVTIYNPDTGNPMRLMVGNMSDLGTVKTINLLWNTANVTSEIKSIRFYGEDAYFLYQKVNGGNLDVKIQKIASATFWAIAAEGNLDLVTQGTQVFAYSITSPPTFNSVFEPQFFVKIGTEEWNWVYGVVRYDGSVDLRTTFYQTLSATTQIEIKDTLGAYNAGYSRDGMLYGVAQGAASNTTGIGKIGRTRFFLQNGNIQDISYIEGNQHINYSTPIIQSYGQTIDSETSFLTYTITNGIKTTAKYTLDLETGQLDTLFVPSTSVIASYDYQYTIPYVRFQDENLWDSIQKTSGAGDYDCLVNPKGKIKLTDKIIENVFVIVAINTPYYLRDSKNQYVTEIIDDLFELVSYDGYTIYTEGTDYILVKASVSSMGLYYISACAGSSITINSMVIARFYPGTYYTITDNEILKNGEYNHNWGKNGVIERCVVEGEKKTPATNAVLQTNIYRITNQQEVYADTGSQYEYVSQITDMFRGNMQFNSVATSYWDGSAGNYSGDFTAEYNGTTSLPADWEIKFDNIIIGSGSRHIDKRPKISILPYDLPTSATPNPITQKGRGFESYQGNNLWTREDLYNTGTIDVLKVDLKCDRLEIFAKNRNTNPKTDYLLKVNFEAYPIIPQYKITASYLSTEYSGNTDRTKVIQNDFISNVDMAYNIARRNVNYFKNEKPNITRECDYMPYVQIGDIVKLYSSELFVLGDYFEVISYRHNLKTTVLGLRFIKSVTTESPVIANTDYYDKDKYYGDEELKNR